MTFENMLEKMANDDYRLAYNLVRAAIARCPTVAVMMNDEMIRKTEISDEMKIGGLPVIRGDGESELTVVAVGKSGKHIMIVFDRKHGAFRCAVGGSRPMVGAKFFMVKPEDVPDFLYEVTMA